MTDLGAAAPNFLACPNCGGWVEDWDGFGVLFHPECGYCMHASITGNICDFCKLAFCNACGVPVPGSAQPLLVLCEYHRQQRIEYECPGPSSRES